MIGFFEQFNMDYAGLRLDPDRAVVGEMLAEKYGIRFRDWDGEIEFRFLSRPLHGTGTASAKAAGAEWAVWPGTVRNKRYCASVGIRIQPGTDDVIQSFYMKHWTENGKDREPAAVLLTDDEFFRGIALLQEYLEAVAVRGNVEDCRWKETA